MMSLPILLPLAADNPLTHVVDHVRWATDGGLALVTNHMIMMVIAAVIMLLVLPIVTRKYQSGDIVLTGKGANFLEAMMLFVRDEVAKPVLGHDTHKYIGFLWTLFFFILTCNLLGLLPLDALQAPLTRTGYYPIYGTATANIAVTAVLASFAFIYWNLAGLKATGIGPWAAHFTGGAPWYMWPIMIPVEILGLFVKPFALAIRLFANMTAGHVLVAVLVSFTLDGFNAGGIGAAIGLGVPVVLGTVAIMLLELFVAFLQAYIFTFLTCVFIGQLVSHHGEDHHAEHDADHTRNMEANSMPEHAIGAGAV